MGSFSAPIEIRGLTKTFKAARAVNDLSFDVQAGSITGFLGPNGSGKTTTLRMLLGLVSPTSGSATINGTPMRLLPNPARTVGAVLDVGSLHPKRTALGHLEIYAAAIGMPTQRAAQVLDMVGLRSVGAHKTGTFSLGMRQRLILATAMLGDPEILVLDEPANGLDPEGMAWLRQFLQTFAGSGRTVLISSHALREVEATVDSVVIVSVSSLVYQGPWTNFAARSAVDCSSRVPTQRSSPRHWPLAESSTPRSPRTDGSPWAAPTRRYCHRWHPPPESRSSVSQPKAQISSNCSWP